MQQNKIIHFYVGGKISQKASQPTTCDQIIKTHLTPGVQGHIVCKCMQKCLFLLKWKQSKPVHTSLEVQDGWTSGFLCCSGRLSAKTLSGPTMKWFKSTKTKAQNTSKDLKSQMQGQIFLHVQKSSFKADINQITSILSWQLCVENAGAWTGFFTNGFVNHFTGKSMWLYYYRLLKRSLTLPAIKSG